MRFTFFVSDTMMTLLDDATERQRALDPTQSFIVQAPAGSGKTELLTQRFLVLLNTVMQPEEILAITFTKKSAAEMRARILTALQVAHLSPAPLEAHAKQTFELAQRALQRDAERQWHLLDNPNRLRIQTIDSFNANLTKQMPILAQFGAPPAICNPARPLYQQAVFELLSHLEEDVPWGPAIAHLLQHFDNDLNKVAVLLMDMLAKRDQWLPYLTLDAGGPQVRKKLESHLAAITFDALQQIKQHFPMAQWEELRTLARFAAENLLREHSTSAITHCYELTDLPGTALADKKTWLGILELLFTKEMNWRKRIDKSIGFPAPSQSKNPLEQQQWGDFKQRMLQLLTELSGNARLQAAFLELHLSPPYFYDDGQWQTLNAFLQLLQVAVAQLKIIFQQQGQIDYIENAQAALLALGSEEAPTDLALALDYKIQHILIDEFQDTSNAQYRLIEKLILGWTPDGGRTLFVVGDPMQSIYRFREAEVGLFISARQQGIGAVALTPLTLTVNFRSSQGIVDWTNHHFKFVLPAVDMVSMGAVAYSPSTPAHQQDEQEIPVKLHRFLHDDGTQQAQALVELVHSIKGALPAASIAILVRSRSHLIAILPALKKAGLAYRAIEIDPLAKRFVIQDLLSLTRALLHPADRIAWLALLRAPWCGLLLQDLWSLSNAPAYVCLWERMQMPAVLAQLTPHGQQRLGKILPILTAILAERHRGPLRQWIERAWGLLGGPACVEQISELDDATVFFELLESLDQGGDLENLSDLHASIQQLYAAPDHQADNTLQIMTIHNAKGLEFDVVLLPHLERRPPPQDKPLLMWMERVRASANPELILAPVPAIGQPANPIYDYIKRQHQIKMEHEYGRLLYVAATRAKQQLHLLFSLSDEDAAAKPSGHSLLEKLWETIKNDATVAYPGAEAAAELDRSAPRLLHRLADEWAHPLREIAPLMTVAYHQQQSGFYLATTPAKYIGTVTHALLQQLSQLGEHWWQAKTAAVKKLFLQHYFTSSGLSATEISSAIEEVITAIDNTLQDARGRWILHPHRQAVAEFRITTVIDNEARALIIDRTFIDETGTRWIIDYKTSTPSIDETLSAFLAKEQQTYAAPMQRYAQALSQLSPGPLRSGLFFPLIPAWIEWESN